VLASFDGANGANPIEGLTLDSAGDLFGTATSGGNTGTNGAGDIFELPANSVTITPLFTFTSDHDFANGEEPRSDLLLDSFGDLFGTTYSGGTLSSGVEGNGTIFELSPALPPARVTIVQQPTTATVGMAVSPRVIVDVDNANAQVVTTDDSNVTLSVDTGPAGGALQGTATVQARTAWRRLPTSPSQLPEHTS
jgi:hypothetical protein